MKEEQKIRLVWVDWLLLLLLAVAVGGGIYYFFNRKEAADPQVSVEYVLQLSAQPVAIAEANGSWERLIQIGKRVVNSNATAQMGHVTALRVEPHRTLTVRDGETVEIMDPLSVDLYVTVAGVGLARAGDSLRIADIRVATGIRGDYYIGDFWAAGAVTVSVKTE